MFVTGGTEAQYAQLASQGQANWPIEVAEGSDWGTPGKEMHREYLHWIVHHLYFFSMLIKFRNHSYQLSDFISPY